MSWSLQDAKNRFSAVVEAALRQGPQAVTRRGNPAVTAIAPAEYKGLRRAAAASRPDFRVHLRAIPPVDAGAADDFPRARAAPRAVDLS
jgi:prevent-host-death family protein